jgi:hypothetical protein
MLGFIIIIDSRRINGTGIFAGPFFLLTLAACHNYSLWQRKEKFPDIYPREIFVYHPEMTHGAGLCTEPASNTFHYIRVNKGCTGRRRIDFSSPHRF